MTWVLLIIAILVCFALYAENHRLILENIELDRDNAQLQRDLASMDRELENAGLSVDIWFDIAEARLETIKRMDAEARLVAHVKSIMEDVV